MSADKPENDKPLTVKKPLNADEYWQEVDARLGFVPDDDFKAIVDLLFIENIELYKELV